MDKEFLAKEYKSFQAKGQFSGGSLAPHIKEITGLIKQCECKTLLDYGCGKAREHKKNKLIDNVTLYDAYCEPYTKKPEGTFDMVICTDVLEHIPMNEVGKIIAELMNYTNKVLFLSICTKPAKKTFRNGVNVHLTIQPESWWEQLLSTIKNIKIVRHYT